MCVSDAAKSAARARWHGQGLQQSMSVQFPLLIGFALLPYTIAVGLRLGDAVAADVFIRPGAVGAKTLARHRRACDIIGMIVDQSPGTEVASYLNFPDPHSFARFFKTMTGKTATQFREEQSVSPPKPASEI